MKALLIDTSGQTAYVAISEDGKIVSSTLLPAARELSKLLLPSIASLLQGNPISYIGIGIGPGSYTGTRTGGIVGKTLAFAWKIPLVPFSSSLLPNLDLIAGMTHQKFKENPDSSQIELVYFSSTP